MVGFQVKCPHPPVGTFSHAKQHGRRRFKCLLLFASLQMGEGARQGG